MAAHLKPETSERRSKTSQVQDGHAPKRTEYAWSRHKALPGRMPARRRGTGSVGRFLGFAGRILPRRCRSQGHEVSSLRLRRRDLRVSGLAVWPVNRSRTFTRLVRAVGAYLKTLGINVFQYLDDWLVVGETYQLALSYQDTVRWVTQRVGFILNEEKSDWVTSQFPLFLGSSLPGISVGGSDRSVAAAYPSRSEVSGESGETLEVVVRSPGQYDSTGARQHIRPLQYFVQERWDMSMPESTVVFLTPAAQETLQWWLHTPNLTSGVPFSDPVP